MQELEKDKEKLLDEQKVSENRKKQKYKESQDEKDSPDNKESRDGKDSLEKKESKDSPDNKVKQKSQNIREEQIRRREEERARRRKQRERQVRMEKIAIVSVLVLLICGGGFAIIWNLSSFRLSRKLSAGNKYTESGDYAMAQASYEEALKIDPTTIEAYRYLAQNNLEQNDSNAAKEVLYTGWKTTQDEGLLYYYCTVILNEAVAEINEKKCDWGTVDKCIQVLRIASDNEDALSFLDTCYDRLFLRNDEENICRLFMDEDAGTDSCQYEDYEKQLRSLLALYEEVPSDALGNILAKYAVIDLEYVYLSVSHLESYHKLLEDVEAVLSDETIKELTACLSKAIETEAVFAGMFTEFAQGNYEKAKEFIVSDTYRQIRDSFINADSGYWEGASSIPVNQEQMAIHKTEDGFRFFWLDYDEYENPQGVITVWGSKQLDDGVQRTSISYEPSSENGEYYPHTEYVITYEYSNVLENGRDVKMNYRLVTMVTTEDGTTTDAIGDWGGENEWSFSY